MPKLRDMTSGNPLGLIIRFSIPLIISDVLQLCYVFADSAVVGRLIGVNAFAAVGSANLFYWLIFCIVLGMSQGFGTILSQHFGAKDIAGLKKAYAMAYGLMTVVSLLISALIIPLTLPILRLLNTPEEILADTAMYLQVMFGGLIVSFFYNICSNVFFALGNSRVPLYAMILSSLLNIALDILLVLYTPLGVAGVAIATVIAQLFAGLFCLWNARGIEEIRLAKADWKPDISVIAKLLRIGLPLGVRDIFAAVASLYTQSAINVYGTVVIAGIATAKRMHTLLFIVGGSLSATAATYVAQNYGARQFARIRRGVRMTAWMVLMGAALFALPLCIFGRQVMALFIAGDPLVEDVLDIAVRQLRVSLLLLPAFNLTQLYRSALRGLGNGAMPLLSGILETIARLVTVAFFADIFGLPALYIAEAVGWPIMALQLFISYQVIFRKKEKLETPIPATARNL